MGVVGFILLGFAVSFNFVVILRKWKLRRYFDVFVDSTILTIMCFLFSGTFSALVTGTLASAFVSVYLYFNPVFMSEFIPTTDEDEDYEYED